MAIQFNEVSHQYQKAKRNEVVPAAIKNINVSIAEKGEFIAVVGHTGSGKSTMLQHMNGLLLPSIGTVQIFDQMLTTKRNKKTRLKAIRKAVGYAFQFPEYQLFAETVAKDICYGPINFGISEIEALERANHYAKLLQIEDIMQKSPFQLSGGQMRRVAIAGILAYEPKILLLDEPTRGLDPIGAKEMMAFFGTLHKEYDKTIVMISHDMDIIYEYATRVIVLDQGEIVYDGKKEALFQSGQYQEHHLEKPRVLQMIDYLNETLGLHMSYHNYTVEELLVALKGKVNSNE